MFPTLAISAGDPLGIGPEVLVKALATRLPGPARLLLFAHAATLHAAARECSIAPFWKTLSPNQPLPDAPESFLIDHPELPLPDKAVRTDHALAGAASFAYLDHAIKACLPAEGGPPIAHALVTAPISKRAWALAGHDRWPGHTELLAHRFNAPRVAMLFDAARLRVVLVTHHVPLLSLGEHLFVDRILDTIRIAHEYLSAAGIARPRIAVCGLNPHAGEQGLLGREEQSLVTPAIHAARAEQIDATGPHPADTVFLSALEGRFDLVVALYHDQGLIAVKTVARDDAVNVTAGLPVPRTSPDHGVAFDIAGQARANPASMRRALELAMTLAARRVRA